MSRKLPIVRPDQLILAPERAGFVRVHQKGSHVKLKRAAQIVIVPDHQGRDVRVGTLRGILNLAGISDDEFRSLLQFQEIAMKRYTVVLTPDLESGGYTVTVPALPGCITDGDTVGEALENAKEAIAAYLEGEDEDSLTLGHGDVSVVVARLDLGGTIEDASYSFPIVA